MRTSIIAFAIGVWLLQRLPALPAPGVLTLASIVLAIAIALTLGLQGRGARRWVRPAAVVLAFASGFLWAAQRAEWRLGDELPMVWESRDVSVTGVITGLPQALQGAQRFVLAVERADGPVPRLIQVSWYAPRTRGGAHAPAVRAGERWRLTLRLKRPHGFVNPHGFDYEAWLLERNIRATGYVRDDIANVRLASFVPGPMNAVHRLRGAVRARFADTLDDGAHAGVLVALAVGDQRAISPEHWEIFRRTAVAHLVSISGLHVSLVALLGGGAAAAAWRRVPWLVLRWPAIKLGALVGLTCAIAYALMAGMGLPTQRALIMLAVVAGALLPGREIASSRVLALALGCVLVVHPWAVLSAGFWLSFGAVGVIVYLVSGRIQRVAGWRAAVKIQLAITLATAPVLLALFGAFSVVAPLANALAIPLVSFLITPLVLLAIVVPLPALLEAAHWLTALMMGWLEWLAAWPHALVQGPALPATLVVAALVGAAWCLLPRGAPARHAGLLAMLPLLLWAPPRPAPGEFRVTVLDVGQGLAVHVQTAGHDLLYDTGPPYGPRADAGSRVVLPYLTGEGVTRVNTLVLSHGDSDHIGGAVSVLAGVQVDALLSSLAPRHALHAHARSSACALGDEWEWDGVRFEILHPQRDRSAARVGNDRSCVLRVSTAWAAVLLPGDIESAAERAVLARAGERLVSDVVVVPHHGSASSSSPAFVRASGARHVIHSVGNLNRHRHPHPTVWARWDQAGATNWRTDAQGAISVSVRREALEVRAERERAARYWHGR